MAKLTEEQLKKWLESDEHMLKCENTLAENQLFKVPLNDNFTFIYYKHITKDESFGLNKDLKNVGLYYKQDGCIYNSDYYIKSICEEDIPIFKQESQKSDFADQLTAAVREHVEKVIDNNVSNLSTRELSDEWKLRDVAYFIEHTAKDHARRLFLSNTEVSDIEYECHCTFNSITDSEYIRFITDKDSLVKLKAEEYIQKNQEDILAQFFENTALKNELQKIYDDFDNDLYRIKAIMEAVNKSGAKTVNVTVNKDNKDFTFKYEADMLNRDPKGYYMNWAMKSSAEKDFEYFFGRNAHFYPEDITQITYCRNVIYDASEFDMAETETADMAQTM